ncbi:auxin-responsive protein [Striga asiatica]|uniref:Auxin-responsive protein n=1 Tax=Striga asiatica TaxID=4170 RepID=A0A5A7QFU9_STRAF|nr:auxin-responsive protein [Striga asiatica]
MARKEAELELGLGLSLGGGSAKDYSRILTAEDFPNGFTSGAVGAGTKRERSDGVDDGSTAAAVSHVVGWPPIRSYRMSTLCNQSKDKGGVGGNENNKVNKQGANVNKEICRFVKVNMDGLPIGRKLDLNAHSTYQSLAKMLLHMFFETPLMNQEAILQPPKLLDGSSEFVLTYEDKEGDWMLVGDVPWRMFLCTVKRLRIMRTSEANGLAPKFQERDETSTRGN